MQILNLPCHALPVACHLVLLACSNLLPSNLTHSEQDIALLDARRGCTMFRKVDVPILGG